MKIQYSKIRFQQKTLDLIETANSIVDDYQSRGYELTLRQLYYQLVARDFIENSEKSYSKIGMTISKARDAGLVDWLAIVDRTRQSRGLTTWESTQSILDIVSEQYRIDKWKNQDYRLFVWVEKEALAGVVQRACGAEGIQVDFLSCRGYMSASTIWREAQKLVEIVGQEQFPIVLHLGDHDPSGLDMTRDNITRLELYSKLAYKSDFEFIRLALNWEQVEKYSPPPNPAKTTDSRFNSYLRKYGNESWELDALDPDILVSLIQNTINQYKDIDRWSEITRRESEEKGQLRYLAQNWDQIC